MSTPKPDRYRTMTAEQLHEYCAGIAVRCADEHVGPVDKAMRDAAEHGAAQAVIDGLVVARDCQAAEIARQAALIAELEAELVTLREGS